MPTGKFPSKRPDLSPPRTGRAGRRRRAARCRAETRRPRILRRPPRRGRRVCNLGARRPAGRSETGGRGVFTAGWPPFGGERLPLLISFRRPAGLAWARLKFRRRRTLRPGLPEKPAGKGVEKGFAVRGVLYAAGGGGNSGRPARRIFRYIQRSDIIITIMENGAPNLKKSPNL